MPRRRDLSDRDLTWLREHEAEVRKAGDKLQARAKRLGVRIEDLHDERAHTLKVARAKHEREQELHKAIQEAHKHKDLWKLVCLDDCTLFLGQKLVLLTVAAKTPWNGGVNAANRTEEHADDCGDKSSQAELYYGFTHGLPGFFPANPPGTGSHEGICDPTLANIGFGAVGSKLDPWQWGLDLVDGPGFESGADSLGFVVVRPYGNEAWHCNIKNDPTDTLRKLKAI